MREAVIIEAVVVAATIRWHRSHRPFPGILQVVVVALVAVTSSHQGPAEVVVVAITSNTEDLLVMEEEEAVVVATNDLRGGRFPRTMATVEAAGAVTR